MTLRLVNFSFLKALLLRTFCAHNMHAKYRKSHNMHAKDILRVFCVHFVCTLCIILGSFYLLKRAHNVHAISQIRLVHAMCTQSYSMHAKFTQRARYVHAMCTQNQKMSVHVACTRISAKCSQNACKILRVHATCSQYAHNVHTTCTQIKGCRVPPTCPYFFAITS